MRYHACDLADDTQSPLPIGDAPAHPALRGVAHKYAFLVAVPAGIQLISMASSSAARIAAAIYASSLVALLGCSALYHRLELSPGVKRWLRKLDHSMIFVLIAGSCTPFAMLTFDSTAAFAVLVAVWVAAAFGVLMKLLWIDAPNWLAAAVYVVFAWPMVVALPELVGAIGVAGTSLVVLGGVFYTGGAVIFALGRPNPAPQYFGFHEIFHVLVILGAAFHYAAIAIFVI